MTLIVEDGTIVALANAYVSVNEVDVYNAALLGNNDWTNSTNLAQEMAIQQATQYIDTQLGAQFIGVLTDNIQVLNWPRTGAVGSDGRSYDSDQMPDVLKRATSELAIKAITESLYNDVANPGTIRKTKDVVGPIQTEVEYFSASQHKLFTAAIKLLDSLIASGSAQIEAERS